MEAIRFLEEINRSLEEKNRLLLEEATHWKQAFMSLQQQRQNMGMRIVRK